MILPIVAYGDPVLRKTGAAIQADHPGLDTLIANMWETMYNAKGVGLAAPQVGQAIRLFIVDTEPFANDEELSEDEQNRLKGFKQVFINARMESESGTDWTFNEGCLSIPDVREDVVRKDTLSISYVDEHFKPHTETFDGLLARVIQHEYDHIEGILFTDKVSSFKKRLLKGRLNAIAKGKINPEYRMRFPGLKKAR